MNGLGGIRLYRRFVIAMALLLGLALPATQLAVAGPAGTIECCCGEHAANEACGCPDCPAATGGSAAHHDDGSTSIDSLSPCHQSPGSAGAPVAFDWVVTELITLATTVTLVRQHWAEREPIPVAAKTASPPS